MPRGIARLAILFQQRKTPKRRAMTFVGGDITSRGNERTTGAGFHPEEFSGRSRPAYFGIAQCPCVCIVKVPCGDSVALEFVRKLDR